jgi:ABC-type molybdate transport system permease subunit
MTPSMSVYFATKDLPIEEKLTMIAFMVMISIVVLVLLRYDRRRTERKNKR